MSMVFKLPTLDIVSVVGEFGAGWLGTGWLGTVLFVLFALFA
jgi:hypothetical protein